MLVGFDWNVFNVEVVFWISNDWLIFDVWLDDGQKWQHSSVNVIS